MFFKPDILALFSGSLLVSLMLLYAAGHGARILAHWDLTSGSELQLRLERRTYLVSTLVAYAFAFQLLSFFLFIYTADRLHPFFTGAMCAAGSLNANFWGYPVVLLKVVNFLLAGWWLILNYTDCQGYDFPLIRPKYLLLLAITPVVLAETLMQVGYFLSLKPEVITSCCGTIFAAESRSLAADIAALPRAPTAAGLAAALAGTLVLGLVFYRTGAGGYWFSGLSLFTFLVALAGLISFISLYIYELPTHHCPFCLLQGEYRYVGYPLYLTLLGGALAGLGVGVLMPWRWVASLAAALPALQKKLALLGLISYALFTIIVLYQIMSSNLRM